MGRPITDKLRDFIIDLSEKGNSQNTISLGLEVSESVVRTVRKCYKAAQEKNFYELTKLLDDPKAGERNVEWACKRNGFILDDVKAFKARIDAKGQPDQNEKDPAQTEAAQDTSPAHLQDIEDAIHVGVKKLEFRLEELQKQELDFFTKMANATTELANGIGLNADVIVAELKVLMSTLTTELVKASNANADVIFAELQKQTELLQAIKSKVRPVYTNRTQ